MPVFIAFVVIVVIAVAVVLLIAARRPAHFRIQRTLTIAAPQATVFAELQDLRRWRDWSPWEGIDPDLRRAYSGAEAGEGAVYDWDSDNKKAGQGRMTILEADPSRKLVLRLDFIRPFAATNTAEFILQSCESGSIITWAMYGPSPFVSRLFGLVFDMDRMVGGDFEKGLARLKSLAETRAAA